MKFTIVYDNPMAAVTQDYKDLQDAIAHADTENNVFCRITGGHVVSGGAIYRLGKGWRVAVNRWRPPEWD
ncbi:MAG: hypothetical protein J6X53_09400, partial [Abditibacteriota bacterium]|nr:hypothetical protein [Abditibacteriota bacterium]